MKIFPILFSCLVVGCSVKKHLLGYDLLKGRGSSSGFFKEELEIEDIEGFCSAAEALDIDRFDSSSENNESGPPSKKSLIERLEHNKLSVKNWIKREEGQKRLSILLDSEKKINVESLNSQGVEVLPWTVIMVLFSTTGGEKAMVLKWWRKMLETTPDFSDRVGSLKDLGSVFFASVHWKYLEIFSDIAAIKSPNGDMKIKEILEMEPGFLSYLTGSALGFNDKISARISRKASDLLAMSCDSKPSLFYNCCRDGKLNEVKIILDIVANGFRYETSLRKKQFLTYMTSDLKDSENFSAFQIAVKNDQQEVVESILNFLDENLESPEIKSAISEIMYASCGEKKELLDYLEKDNLFYKMLSATDLYLLNFSVAVEDALQNYKRSYDRRKAYMAKPKVKRIVPGFMGQKY